MGRKKRLMRAEKKKQVQEMVDSQETDVPLGVEFDGSKFDASNALILPEKKAQNKNNQIVVKKKKNKLSKNQLKKLQNVVQRRHKKAGRNQILEEYSKHQIAPEELATMFSISALQTRGLKKMDDSKNNKRKADNREKSDAKRLKFDEAGSSVSSDTSCDETVPVKSAAIVNKVFSLTPVVSNVTKDKAPSETTNEKTSSFNQETVSITVNRNPEIEKWRKSLPVYSEEQSIMEAIRYNNVVVVCGETGSGKTTQIPQFLYEAGYARTKMICVTEPRRVAAMAMSQRVGHEMNLTSKEVSYHIRYEKNVTKDTKIKFVTDGVLLREVQQDFLLSPYSVIIVDEAHERSVFSDILVGLLSRIVPLREKKGNPLKLIIMSATLRIDDFIGNRKLFKEIPPVIKVENRQFPVTIKFVKHTPENYMDAAFEKVCHVHRTQSAGGILVFVTGRNQVNVLCKKLQNKYPSNKNKQSSGKTTKKRKVTKLRAISKSTLLPTVDDDRFAEVDDEFDNCSDSESDVSIDDSFDDEDGERVNSKEPLFCLPLFSQLPKHTQDAVFKGAPLGHRLVVVATNVAETSLTIPGIKYVIDTGKVKTKVYDKTTGVCAFIVTWSSKASAEQRAGRAGRTCPGICYRLYSSAVFSNEFPAFADPEIVLKPIDDLVLQMKSLNVTNVINFPFPTSPSIEALEASEKRLVQMGALEEMKTTLTSDGKKCNKLTSLGKAMSHFPVSPRYSKMLALTKTNLIPHVIAIVSGLTVQEIFLQATMNEGQKETPSKWNQMKLKWTGTGNEHLLGDFMIILKAIGASEFMSSQSDFHQKIGLRHKAMVEVHKLRRQLFEEVCRVFGSDRDQFPAKMCPPTDSDARYLRQLLLSAFFDQVAKRVQEDNGNSGNKKVKRQAYQSTQVESLVYLDPTSIIKETCPEFVVYQEIFEKDSKIFMRNVAAIEPEWLPLFAHNLCNLSDPLDDPPPSYDNENDTVMCHITGTFGPYAWPVPQTAIPFPTSDGQVFKWFARFLLEGHVHSFFLPYATKLLTPASMVVKPWAKLQTRTTGIILRLTQDRISSLASLYKKWTLDSTYLLTEYLDWLPQTWHEQVSKSWPPKQEHETN